MAEIVCLPHPADHAGTQRLAEMLAAMIAGGSDPGPRGPQIRGLGLSIETLVHELRERLADLGVAEELGEFTARLDQVASLARSYEAAEIA